MTRVSMVTKYSCNAFKNTKVMCCYKWSRNLKKSYGLIRVAFKSHATFFDNNAWPGYKKKRKTMFFSPDKISIIHHTPGNYLNPFYSWTLYPEVPNITRDLLSQLRASLTFWSLSTCMKAEMWFVTMLVTFCWVKMLRNVDEEASPWKQNFTASRLKDKMYVFSSNAVSWFYRTLSNKLYMYKWEN